MITSFQEKEEEIGKLIHCEAFPLLTKRLIDLTIDTGKKSFYRKTVHLLDWLDKNPDNKEQKKEQFSALWNELHSFLADKAVSAPDPENTILLSTNNLIRSYRKSAFALGPISIDLKAGEIVGLVGENGNGKTTLLRTLCGELQVTGGKVEYRFPYRDVYDLRSKLVYIPQRTPSWQGSLLSNLQFTAATYGTTGEENHLLVELAIARMGLRKFRSYRWKDLSSGYKMRFELARALLRRPQVLLIDEPLANLDILAQQVVLDDLRDIACSPFRPLGIMLSSQQLYEVEKTSDRVIFLKNGLPLHIPGDTDATFVEIPKCIIEFESEWKQEPLREALNKIGLEKLQINGGTYVATFPAATTRESFLQCALNSNIPVNYFRDISRSARRFFLS